MKIASEFSPNWERRMPPWMAVVAGLRVFPVVLAVFAILASPANKKPGRKAGPGDIPSDLLATSLTWLASRPAQKTTEHSASRQDQPWRQPRFRLSGHGWLKPVSSPRTGSPT